MMYSCNVFGISRQAYYKSKHRRVAVQQESEEIIHRVQQQRACMPRVGTRKLYYLPGNDLPIGRDKLFTLLKANHLLIKPKKSYTKTPCLNIGFASIRTCCLILNCPYFQLQVKTLLYRHFEIQAHSFPLYRNLR
jgi:hypothetical protein